MPETPAVAADPTGVQQISNLPGEEQELFAVEGMSQQSQASSARQQSVEIKLAVSHELDPSRACG